MKRKIFIILIFLMILVCESFSIHIDKQRNSQKNTLPGNNKGQILIHLSLPYINSFHFSPWNENLKNSTGFMGYSVGLDYFYNTNQYVSLTVSKIMDYYIPVAFVDKWKEYELMSSDYLISLSSNQKIRRFSLDYGILFTTNNWEIVNHSWDKNSSSREPVKKTNYALGLIFSSYFQATRHFFLGVIYRPTFFRLNIDPSFKYEHTISIDFAWKIPLKK